MKETEKTCTCKDLQALQIINTKKKIFQSQNWTESVQLDLSTWQESPFSVTEQ